MIYIAKELLIKNDDSDILLIHNEEGNRERERVVRKSGQEQARFTLRQVQEAHPWHPKVCPSAAVR